MRKKFVLAFVIGAIIIIASRIRSLRPIANPIIGNPFILWCDKLVSHPSGLGEVEITITQNNQPVANLTVNLSVKKPPPATYPGAARGEFMIPEKACFVATNQKGIGTFKKVPVGTVYLFFNNDPAAYPKRFGQPNFAITQVEVKTNETSRVVIKL